MKVQRVKASDRVAATAGRVALRYGPLLYNVESVDQDLNNILNPGSILTTEWRGDLLGGVMAIKGTWANGSSLIAIPNYTRSNRGFGDSTRADRRPRGCATLSSSVWLKDQ